MHSHCASMLSFAGNQQMVWLRVPMRCYTAQVYSVQVGSWKWTEHTSEVEGDAPTPRSGHTAVALPDGRHLALFGGGDADKDLFYSGVSVLDTATWTWSSPRIQVLLSSDSSTPQLPKPSTPYSTWGTLVPSVLQGPSCATLSTLMHC